MSVPKFAMLDFEPFWEAKAHGFTVAMCMLEAVVAAISNKLKHQNRQKSAGGTQITIKQNR